MDLLTSLSRRAHQAGQLLLGDRQDELVGVAGQLEKPLGGAAGHVEQHRVGQRGAGGAQPAGEQGDDVPEKSRASFQFGPDDVERDPGDFGALQCPG